MLLKRLDCTELAIATLPGTVFANAAKADLGMLILIHQGLLAESRQGRGYARLGAGVWEKVKPDVIRLLLGRCCLLGAL